MKSKRSSLAALAAVILIAFASSCSKKLTHMIIPNQLPEVRLTAAPIDTSSRYFYSYTVDWIGYDPDGRVDHYLYAIDPPSREGSDTTWVITSSNEKMLTFRAGHPDSTLVGRSIDFHVFVIKAVDNRGAPGPPVFRAFFSFTQAPSVLIGNPRPSHLIDALLTPSIHIAWSGQDPDGVFTSKPVKYKFILLGPGSQFPLALAAQDPDSLRRFYAPNFVGWDSTSAETTRASFTNLTPDQTYIFVVVAFDEAGAYTPVFTLDTNMLRMRIGFAQTLGPKITFFNEFLNYTYPSGGYTTNPAAEVFLELPAREKLTMNWFADPPSGADMKSYRWALDIADVSDETPRTNDLTDLSHWSSASLNITSASLGPFEGGEEHRLYVEAEDNVGLRSLGIIRFQVVAPSFDRELGIVDDTRFRGDGLLATGCVDKPKGLWPNRAELDTFLYARGGFEYQCYPAGTQSTPGLFNGYDFDTLGTRRGKSDLTVHLAELGKFRHLIWLVDGNSATFAKPGTDPTQPITALRYMSSPRRFNTFAAYVKQGGLIWLAGGGGGYATMIPWNDPNNDRGGAIFSVNSTRKELVPGRFMYDLTMWQSEFFCIRATASITRFSGRFGDTADVVGRYGTISQYAGLPPRLEAKDVPPEDPLPPLRTSRSEFYQQQFDLETLHFDNNIVEDVDPGEPVDEQSTLDSLFTANGNSLPGSQPGDPKNICMTYYHGPSHKPVIFSGMSLWNFKRSQCQEVIDFVLQSIWHLPKNTTAMRASAPLAAKSKVPLRTLAPRPWGRNGRLGSGNDLRVLPRPRPARPVPVPSTRH